MIQTAFFLQKGVDISKASYFGLDMGRSGLYVLTQAGNRRLWHGVSLPAGGAESGSGDDEWRCGIAAFDEGTPESGRAFVPRQRFHRTSKTSDFNDDDDDDVSDAETESGECTFWEEHVLGSRREAWQTHGFAEEEVPVFSDDE